MPSEVQKPDKNTDILGPEVRAEIKEVWKNIKAYREIQEVAVKYISKLKLRAAKMIGDDEVAKYRKVYQAVLAAVEKE